MEKEQEEEEVLRSRGDTTEVAKLHLKLNCGSQTRGGGELVRGDSLECRRLSRRLSRRTEGVKVQSRSTPFRIKAIFFSNSKESLIKHQRIFHKCIIAAQLKRCFK